MCLGWATVYYFSLPYKVNKRTHLWILLLYVLFCITMFGTALAGLIAQGDQLYLIVWLVSGVAVLMTSWYCSTDISKQSNTYEFRNFIFKGAMLLVITVTFQTKVLLPYYSASSESQKLIFIVFIFPGIVIQYNFVFSLFPFLFEACLH